MGTKVATVIADETRQGLTMKVGTRSCFVRLASVREGGEYTILRLCMDWTYQEFVLQDKSDPRKRLFVSSDDCCEYERITVKEAGGKVVAENTPRRVPRESDEVVVAEKEKFNWRFWRYPKFGALGANPSFFTYYFEYL